MANKSAKIKAVSHKGGWFRMYADILNDSKVQLIPDRMFKFWVNCLALTSEKRGYLPEPRDIAFRLHLSLTEVEDDLANMMTHGLVEAVSVDGKTKLQPHNWFDWQPAPDPSRHRMRRLRQSKKSTSENGGDGDVTVRDGAVTGRVTKCAYSKSQSELPRLQERSIQEEGDLDAHTGARSDDEVPL